MRKNRSLARRAFTLIELLLVIAIIGIVSALLLVAIKGAQNTAKKTASEVMFQQWAQSLSRYKAEYKYYPHLGTGGTTSGDSYYTLDNEDMCANFVRALWGRNIDGTELTSAQRRELNPRATEFCSFPNNSFMNDDPKTRRLTDGFGNGKIRVILDTDNDGMITLRELPENTLDLGPLDGNRLNAKVVIYTLERDGSDYRDVIVKQ